MPAVGTDFESPVTWPTPGSTQSTASWPDADEAVGRKASQPHPVAPALILMGQPNASTPYPSFYGLFYITPRLENVIPGKPRESEVKMKTKVVASKSTHLSKTMHFVFDFSGVISRVYSGYK